ncbi:hypothetical protein D9613_000877 [Agrocybe pediades]|uniref:Extracellular serine-rich protein n=1 Tax=Agrocybe pediades TaxID=84607 RepID=A0A8H4VS52_9AGAR|nr:hypothetical protein D9613_000877 [Agrocybe pediades]KAF9553022.1 hypothetical protein CPC08DRAFT_714103 [Agrocybe pediades]
MRSAVLFTLSALIASACAKNIVITVGGNKTADENVFNPESVEAKIGDVLFFNFTGGNFSATQSTFAAPCVPAHLTNSTINGFDSGPRNTVNGTAITNMPVPVTTNDTIWYFDINTCAQGGVGVVNVNDSTLETLDGAKRNAIRLNGTDADSDSTNSSNSASASRSSTAPSSSQTSQNNTNNSGADRALFLGLTSVVPVLAALLVISV